MWKHVVKHHHLFQILSIPLCPSPFTILLASSQILFSSSSMVNRQPHQVNIRVKKQFHPFEYGGAKINSLHGVCLCSGCLQFGCLQNKQFTGSHHIYSLVHSFILSFIPSHCLSSLYKIWAFVVLFAGFSLVTLVLVSVQFHRTNTGENNTH